MKETIIALQPKMKAKHPFVPLCAMVVFAAAGALSLNAHAQCNIYMSTNQQAIDGYGFSSAWCGQLSAAKNNSLYGTLGMSLLRVRIDDGGNWADETVNAANAHAAGARVLGTAWSGPAAWIDTQQAMNGSLLPQYYADYANWLGQAASALNLDWVSPANEPDLGWMSWTSDQLRTWIGQYGACIGRPMLAPESCWFADSYGNPILDDPKAGPNVVIYGGHYYGNSPAVHQDALNKGKHVWMTEFYFDGPDDMGVCMQIAQQISDSMNCQLSAYIWWWDNDSDTNTVLVTSDGAINKNGYTMGQFAKWVRPGSTRVTADYHPSAGVSVTAYNVNGSAVIVAVNTNTAGSVNQQFIINNGNGASLEGYRTSSSESMADIGSFAVSGGSFTANLPAQSITTFVQTNGAPFSLPSPWAAQDVGAVGVVGSSIYTNSVVTNGVFTMTASGDDIWNISDAFRFIYETNGGNCTIIARVSSEQSTNANAKAGVMIRNSLDPSAANVFIGVTPSNEVIFQHRSSTGGGSSSNSVAGLSAPYWVKLAQSGSTVTGYYSANGTSWTQLGTTTISLGSMQTNAWGQVSGPIQYAGLAFCNNGNTSLSTATFDNVSAPGWPIPSPSAPTGLSATAGVEQVILSWQGGNYATSNSIGRATVSVGPYTTIATVRGTGYVDADLVGGTTYYYVVKAFNGAGQSTNTAPASVTTTANVPSPWVAQDIGAVGVGGSAGEAGSENWSNGVFTVAGSGSDIWGSSDAFRFVYETTSGNCTIIARVISLQEPTSVTIDPWAKTGVMIRNSLDAGAANAFIAVTPSNGVTWQNRSSANGGSGNAAMSGLGAPCWVKLARSGNAFTGYYSPDGTNWTQQGTATITMASTVYVGLAVTAHNSSGMATATFDNVAAPGWPPPVPPPPTGLVVVDGMEHATLNWLASSNATSYNVKRSTTNGGPYAIVANIATTNCTDSGLTVGTTYYYVVSAVNAGGESANSDQASATPTTAPELTGGIIGTAGSWGGFGNTIANVFDNNLTTFFDGPDANGDWVGLDFGVGVSNVITRINYCPRSGFESRMTNGIFQGANQADFSDAVTLFTITNQPATGVFTSATNNNASAFRYVRYLSPDNGFGNVAELEFYGYLAGASVRLPPVPTGLVATAVSSGQISLVWNSFTNGATCNVKRSTTNGGPYAVIASGVTATNYSDGGLAGGTIYYYVVSAVISGNESANSAQASAATLSPTLGSLVHRYSFNETGGTTIADSVGGPVWKGTLPNGGAFSNGVLMLSSGSSQYADLPAGIVGSLSNCTVMAWVNLNSTDTWSRIFDFGNNTTTYMFLTPQNGTSGTLRFAITTNSSGGEQQINCASTLTTGVWHQVAVTLNTNCGILYLDGVAVGTNTSMTLNPAILGVTTNNFIGRSQWADPYFNGSFDEFRIYNAGLSPAEIAATAALGSGSLLDNSSPPVRLARTGTNLTFSWPLANAGFTLQSRTNLVMGNWLDVASPAPQIAGGQWQMVMPRPGDTNSAFYRLSK
jgi:glucuronoarabinoxylan endo-1,4-beta-xylanase